jgi:hypothetical protein
MLRFGEPPATNRPKARATAPFVPPAAARAAAPLARPAAETIDLGRAIGNRQLARLVTERRLARQPSREVTDDAARAIELMDDDGSKKELLSLVLSVSRRHELRAFTRLLKQAHDDDYEDHFVHLVYRLNNDWGTRIAVGLLQGFADAGVDLTKELPSYGEPAPLAAVATFKSLTTRLAALVRSGDLSKADTTELQTLLRAAEDALRQVDPPKPAGGPGPRVKLAGVAGAAAAAWSIAGGLAADDVTVVGVADDVAIPFVIIAAAALTAIAVFTGGPKPEKLDFGPARRPVEAALRKMVELVAISQAMAVQGARAAGQLGNIAVHLARLLVLGSVGGHPPGEPPKKNDRDDKHWWSEIKASLKNFFQATKGASRKQIMRELLKAGYTDAEIAEIEAALARAGEMMGETVELLLPPP